VDLVSSASEVKVLGNVSNLHSAKAHLAGGDVKTRNLFGVIVNYCRVLSFSIANFATKRYVIFGNI